MRIFLILVGVALALFGVACGASGLAAYRSVDSDGFVTGNGRMLTTTAAFVIDTAEFRELEEDDRGGKSTLRIRAESNEDSDVLIAVGPAEAVEAYVEQGSHQVVRELGFDPFEYEQVNLGGDRALPPAGEGVFRTSVSGEGRQELLWPIETGDWRAVIMHVDGSPGVDVDAEFGVKFPNLRGFAIAGMVIGSLCFLLGVLLAVLQFRGRRKGGEAAVEAVDAPG